jgi:hypothetical protein
MVAGGDMSDLVWVFLYKYWDEHTQSERLSSLYATDEVIRAGLGKKVHESGIRVDVAVLTDGGIYIPSDEQPASNQSVA